jgi:hypothetical protein
MGYFKVFISKSKTKPLDLISWVCDSIKKLNI